MITHPKVTVKSHRSNVRMSHVSLHKTKGLEVPDNGWSRLYNNYVHVASIFWDSYKLTVYSEMTHSEQP